jgi:hypothetical protein
MLVAAAQGSEQVLDAFRRGVDNEADVVATESVRISGREAILHIDRQETGEELEIERVWVLVTEGDRAFVVAGAYDASRSERVRELVRASVLSAEWDPSASGYSTSRAGWCSTGRRRARSPMGSMGTCLRPSWARPRSS